jgi:hypothetical protein
LSTSNTSIINEQQPDQATYFLDRTHGRKVLPEYLRSCGMQVMVHADHFAQEEIDPVWIAECARRNWTVITGDRRIEKVPENREAVIQSGCKVFLLTDSNSKPLIWASAIIVAAERMRQLVARHDGHFFAPLASNVVLT